MALFITATAPDELTLTPAPAGQGWLRWLIGGFGVLGLLIGGGLLATRYPNGADFTNLLATAFVVMGAGFVALAFASSGRGPIGLASLVFDPRLRAVRVRSASAGPQPADAFLPYDDIASVDVVTRSHFGSPDSYQPNKTTYTYHAVLHLHNGAAWVLTDESSREVAEAQVAQLSAAWRTGASAATVPVPLLPPQVSTSRQGASTSLCWQNQVTRREVAGKLLGLGLFGVLLALFMVIIIAQQLPVFAYVVWGFIALVFGFVAFAHMRRLRKDAKNRYVLVFGPADVTYLEEALATGEVTHRVRIPLADWYGLSYAFDATVAEHEAVLLLTKAAHQHSLLQQQRADSSPKEEVQLLGKGQAQALYLKQFSPTQRLDLVNWVRTETTRRLATSPGI